MVSPKSELILAFIHLYGLTQPCCHQEMFKMGHWQEEHNRRQARYPASPAASSMGPLTLCHGTYTHDARHGCSTNYREFMYQPPIRSGRCTHGSRSSSLKSGMRMVLRPSRKTIWTNPIPRIHVTFSFLLFPLVVPSYHYNSNFLARLAPLPFVNPPSCRINVLSHPSALHNLNLNYMHGLIVTRYQLVPLFQIHQLDDIQSIGTHSNCLTVLLVLGRAVRRCGCPCRGRVTRNGRPHSFTVDKDGRALRIFTEQILCVVVQIWIIVELEVERAPVRLRKVFSVD